MGIDNRNSI